MYNDNDISSAKTFGSNSVAPENLNPKSPASLFVACTCSTHRPEWMQPEWMHGGWDHTEFVENLARCSQQQQELPGYHRSIIASPGKTSQHMKNNRQTQGTCENTVMMMITVKKGEQHLGFQRGPPP